LIYDWKTIIQVLFHIGRGERGLDKSPILFSFLYFIYAALSTIVTSPVSPSTRIVSPVLIADVAIPVPVTEGIPYSRQTIAA
jgi:hypothetical protein